MKSGAFRRGLGLVLLYVGVFFVLVIVQFSRGPGFSEHIGRLSVSASIPKTRSGETARRPDSVQISYSGLNIGISSSSPAQVVAPDGSSKPLHLLSVQRAQRGILVQLEGGLSLLCGSSQQDRGFTLNASGLGPGTVLQVKYTLTGGAKLVSAEGGTTLQGRNASYTVALDGVSIKDDQGIISIAPQNGATASLALIQAAAPAAGSASAAPGNAEQFVAQAPKDPAAFAAEISAWRDKAWSGLSSSRFDADKIAWKAPDGSEAFTERGLDAYLAEALARGSFDAAFAKVRDIRERSPDKLTYLSAPYLGGLAAKMPVFEAADLSEVKRVGQQIQDKTFDLFTKEQLLHFLLDRAPYSMAQDALRFAASVDLSKLDTRQAVGLLGCVIEAKSLLKDDENPFAGLGGGADRLVADVRKSSDGFFLSTEDDGTTDLRLSLLAGTYLVQYGTMNGKDMLVGVGQSLVEGVLGLADAQGFTPARLLVKAGVVDQKTGSIAPEELYPLIAGNPYYPHEVSFYKDIAPGVWAWTCAPELSVTTSSGREVFNVRFPVGAAHYLVIYGVKPFRNIQLYDIDYSPDAAFETYDASGYLYHKPTNALYLKMKHKKDVEDIKLAF